MSDESLPQLTKAPIPVQTHTLRLEERIAKGKALRDVATRQAQKEWKPPANRPDPVDLLIENSKGRVEELLPIRYGRMMVSPFAFYRGAAAIMAHDLAHTPATGFTVLADGDCHLVNFGGFAQPVHLPHGRRGEKRSNGCPLAVPGFVFGYIGPPWQRTKASLKQPMEVGT